MGDLAKQFAIYIGLLLVCCTYTVISPFYPKVAEDKGLDLWIIGIVFALNPFANLIISPFIGRYMSRIGRKTIVLAAYVLTGVSMLILSPIELVDESTVLTLSFISRVLGGFGASCLFTAITSIFVSDYPERLQTMLGRMEAAIGLGLILGPILGGALYLINLLAALLFVGCLILGFSPFAWKMLGEFREYHVKEINIDRVALFFKPKIYLTLIMDMSFLFSFGFLAALLEIHLSNFGMPHLLIVLCFVFQSSIYLLACLSSNLLIQRIDERTAMFIGIIFLGISYILMGPWGAIFPKEAWVVVISLPFMSIGQALTYSNFYSVFSIPYMIKSAEFSYGYTNDDMLTDVIASFKVLAAASGEIIGPLYAGFMSELVGIENACLLLAAISFAFAIVFAFGTEMVTDLFRKPKKSSLLINTKVVPE